MQSNKLMHRTPSAPVMAGRWADKEMQRTLRTFLALALTAAVMAASSFDQLVNKVNVDSKRYDIESNLIWINLSNHNISDADLDGIESQEHLKTIQVTSDRLTDLGIIKLTKCKQLGELAIVDCPLVTRQAVEQLRSELPDCYVIW